MVDFLAKRFIKNYKEVENREVRAAYGTLGSVVGVLANIVLVAIKMLIGLLSGSVSVMADALNNLSDAGGSVISFISFKISAKPADRDHPYGHARMEYVTSMIVSFLVLIIGFQLLKSSIESLLDPSGTTSVSVLTLVILGVAIVGKLLLGLFYFSLSKKIRSDVMRASGVDSFSDMLSTAAVLFGVAVQFFFPSFFLTPYVDGAVGLLVSVLILFAGLKILNETKNHILGEAPDPALLDAIREVVSSFPETLGIHDLVVHQYGPGATVASLHVEVDGTKNMFDIHDAIDNMERAIEEELSVICTIHTDPISTDEDTTGIRRRMEEKLSEIDPRLTLHDFRMVRGSTHSNLIFDVSVPFEVKLSSEAIRDAVAEKAKELSDGFYTVIHIDRT